MTTALIIIEMIVAALLVGLVLIQSGDAGITSIWSGGGETYHAKRGVEKVVFILTIVMAVVFVLNAVAILFFSK